MDPSLIIGIVSYERPADTIRCLNSLRLHQSIDFRIVIADNGSRLPETRTFLDSCSKEYELDLICLPENRGPAAGRNAILSRVKNAGAIAFLDNDVMVLPGWEDAAMEALQGGADLLQPKLLKKDMECVDRGPNVGYPHSLNANPHFIGRNAARNAPEVSQSQTVSIVGGTCVIKREVFEKLGSYDENLFVGEDYDLSYRAAAAGLAMIYEPKCEMIHDHKFEISYDIERNNLEGLIHSFIVFWKKHKLCLLCPRYFGWYCWLLRNKEPMYLPSFQQNSALLRRMRRRLARDFYMRQKPHQWTSEHQVEHAIAKSGLLTQFQQLT